jgi:hypothetical protein
LVYPGACSAKGLDFELTLTEGQMSNHYGHRKIHVLSTKDFENPLHSIHQTWLSLKVTWKAKRFEVKESKVKLDMIFSMS